MLVRRRRQLAAAGAARVRRPDPGGATPALALAKRSASRLARVAERPECGLTRARAARPLSLTLSPLRGARGPEPDPSRMGAGARPLSLTLSPLRGARGPEPDPSRKQAGRGDRSRILLASERGEGTGADASTG